MPIDDVGALRAAWQLYPARSDSPADRLLSIGEFADRSRLSMKALRLYDRLGVLRPAVVNEHTGYRRYRQGQLTSARLVAMLRRLDMPLSEVAAVLSAPEGAAAGVIAAYWESIERRVASQRELALHLQRRLSGSDGRLGDLGPVARRQVPECRVLTEQRHILASELSGWLDTAMAHLATGAAGYGGMIAPSFVVYHGEVSQDSDGPVEICVPIDPAADAPSSRVEPAHEEVYVRLRKAQVEYPQILSAFDVLAQWITDSEVNFAGPPREIYFTDFQAAAATDEVCDVAFPIR